MTDTCIMGIDPGVSGAVAFYFPDYPTRISVYDVPSVGKEINAPALAQLIKQYKPTICYIESVNAMPKQGVTSSFNFGQAYGCVRGVVAAAGVPTVLVTPRKWKAFFALDSDKEKSRRLAIMKWPNGGHFNRKKDDGRAEAALIALYGSKQL